MIYVWVRKTTDWADEQAFLAQLAPAFEPKVAVWNETFTMPYHLFRHELRQIAQLNISKVEGAVCAEWDEIPDGELVLPVDDDDWFAPDVAEVLESRRDPEALGYHWKGSFIEVPTNFRHELAVFVRRFFPDRPLLWICMTNNYALVKSPEMRERLRSHRAASAWVEGEGRALVRRIERRLSVMNRTLASQTTFGMQRASITRSELLRKLHRHRKLYERPLRREIAWCKPYVAMMSDLMSRLQLRDGHGEE